MQPPALRRNCGLACASATEDWLAQLPLPPRLEEERLRGPAELLELRVETAASDKTNVDRRHGDAQEAARHPQMDMICVHDADRHCGLLAHGNARIQRRAPPAHGQTSAAWIPDPSLAALTEPSRGGYTFRSCYQAGPHPLPAETRLLLSCCPGCFPERVIQTCSLPNKAVLQMDTCYYITE